VVDFYLPPLLIRCDASARIGTGHVMRCLALAQKWQEAGGKTVFAHVETTPAMKQRLSDTGFEFVNLNAVIGDTDDATQTIEHARALKAPWIVADGYSFGATWQKHVKESGIRLLVCDDYGHAERYYANLVLNPNPHASAELYRNRAPHTQLLLGTHYVLLRREFNDWRGWHGPFRSVARKVLVTLGGSDPNNVTTKVIEELNSLGGTRLEITVVIGGSNPNFKAPPPAPSSIRFVVDEPNMPKLMAWADVAIAAAGTTSWELAFMGLPSLVLVLADNQLAVADALDAAAVARKTTPERVAAELASLLTDSDARCAMSRRGRELVDGEGAGRLTMRLRASMLDLHRVGPEDCRLLWVWANEPEARALSLSPDPIPWETHQAWFAARVHSTACLFYIAADQHGSLIGQIRYDITGDEAVVSVSIAKEARGHGYGAALIIRGSERCFADKPVQTIRAYVKPNNVASVKAFIYASYSDGDVVDIRGQSVRQFVLSRDDYR
jgi:UDP-2,4-diacetamido-2,4,6-trideoxy-beta-L-altropyranose hydrolase